MSPDRSQPQAVAQRWDRVFRALASEPRRQIVLALMDGPAGDWAELPEAAMAPTIPYDRETLAVQCHHTHLPILADGGYVEWKRDPLCARRGPAFEELAVVFESLQSRATAIPDRLVFGCRRLVEARKRNGGTER